MQKASFHTHFTHTHCLSSLALLPKHCKGKARPYIKITSPIPKMQLLLSRDLLTSASNTHGSLARRGKTHMKGYFSGYMPLFMQDMVVGSLSIRRKCSREAKTSILLRRGADKQRPASTCRAAEPCHPSAASSRRSSAPTTAAKEQGQPPPPASLQSLQRLQHHLLNLMVVWAIA